MGRRVRQADTFARVGGDEFVILMEIARDRSDAVPVAETVVAAIGEIEMFAERGLRVGASVGIACSGPPPFRERIADELYLSVLSRRPTADEIAEVTDLLQRAGDKREVALKHLAWALLASTEFCVNH